MELATFGAGCFWCTEAIFQRVKGVKSVTPGYMGGGMDDPAFMDIANGDTGHAEVIQIEYDERVISFCDLLIVFFRIHNPAKPASRKNVAANRYRSVIFYENIMQRRQAEAMTKKLEKEGVFGRKITTGICPATEFYRAEQHHQNYYTRNANKPYCASVIRPKLEKLISEFRNILIT